MKSSTLLAVAVSFALVACGEQALSKSPAAVDATQPPASAAATDAAADPLEGTWTTQEMSEDELKQAALDAGNSAADVEEFFSGPLGLRSDAAAFQIRFLGGQASQFMTPAGGDATPQHDGPYRLTDDQTLVWTDGDCDTTVTFELEGDALAFTEIVEDECPAAEAQIAHITFLLSGPYARTD